MLVSIKVDLLAEYVSYVKAAYCSYRSVLLVAKLVQINVCRLANWSAERFQWTHR